MAFTQITGDNISTATNATITALAFQNTNSVLALPAGSTADRPTTPALGSIRYNSDDDNAEIYITNVDGSGTDGWAPVAGGGPSVGNDSIIRTNGTQLTEDAAVGAGAPNNDDKFSNGFTIGPITVSGATTTLTILADGNLVIF
ncbi:hypothetical protein CPRG_00042 [Synechococcus phage Syn30]|uniref:Uncharacterized protein n=1 Tax=Synechococcus phage Syn30 TaxID=536474 RepID=M4SN06_9CAUD|nr:hypothetical protein CPRG_00042 [Synechococcus phage Syn30]AGH56126.1 hypothetical protein CPRG_00042 [Synechococcus phage Syn30]|tara:strand:+ start:3319 stop:3750 length:432 start_codon:yes stop_codon:yes gene_type:complete